MEYFIREVQVNDGNVKTAGAKARDDMENILTKIGIIPVNIPSFETKRYKSGIAKKIYWHMQTLKIWQKKLSMLKKDDVIYIQFPIIEHFIFQASFFKKLSQKGIRVILIIHDLEILRGVRKKDISIVRRIRLYLEEKNMIFSCSKLIVHNSCMKKYFLRLGISEKKIVNLKIFDYLIPDYDEIRISKRIIEKQEPVIIAGNLQPHKAQYVYRLPENYSYNLYGVNYKGKINEKITYCGSYLPDELPYVLKGSFGLVWDGISAHTCKGVYGDYLRINNPHKTSLYLASGIPVIIWNQAALAGFIKKNQCGITVDSLYDIERAIALLTEDEYKELKKNAEKISIRLREGYFTFQAIKASR